MNNKKLPIISIFLEAISLPYKHYRMLLKVGLPLIISVSLFIALNHFLSDVEYAAPIIVLYTGIAIAFLTSLIMAIVSCHRIFLMSPSVVEGSRLFSWTGNEIKYAGWWILIGICAVLIAIPFMLLFVPFVGSLLENISENTVILYTLLDLINIPFYYVVSRWSLVLPSCAIDKHGKSLTWSWSLSKGNGLRLTLLIGILPFFLDILFDLLPVSDSIAYSFFYVSIYLVVGVIEIGLLSLSYAFLASEKNDENCNYPLK